MHDTRKRKIWAEGNNELTQSDSVSQGFMKDGGTLLCFSQSTQQEMYIRTLLYLLKSEADLELLFACHAKMT